MKPPSLSDLPPPPPGRTGWPWTEACDPLPPTRSDGTAWPRITIVTPSYNQGQYIEETIRSILLQGYPNLEYIVMDGGSTDGAVEVIRKYDPWIDHWESEPDRGQAHAINKGLVRATGEIFQWINSDDLLEPDALSEIASRWTKNTTCVAGSVTDFSQDGSVTCVTNAKLSARLLITGTEGIVFHQPGIWLSRPSISSVPVFPEHLHYCFDSRFLVGYFDKYPNIEYINFPLVRFRVHANSKTGNRDQLFPTELIDFLEDIIDDDLAPARLRNLARRRRVGIIVKRELLPVHHEHQPLKDKLNALVNVYRSTSGLAILDRFFVGTARKLAAECIGSLNPFK